MAQTYTTLAGSLVVVLTRARRIGATKFTVLVLVLVELLAVLVPVHYCKTGSRTKFSAADHPKFSTAVRRMKS